MARRLLISGVVLATICLAGCHYFQHHGQVSVPAPATLNIPPDCMPAPTPLLLAAEGQKVIVHTNGKRVVMTQKGVDPGDAFFPGDASCDPKSGKKDKTFDIPPGGGGPRCGLYKGTSGHSSDMRWSYGVAVYEPGADPSPTPICTIDPDICIVKCQ